MKLPENRNDAHPTCPGCGGRAIRRDGRTPAGRQRWRCKKCGRHFCEPDPARATAQRIAERMLEEGLLPSGIARVMDGYVSERWLYLKQRRMRHERG